jgi:hypothetical protein
VTNFNSPELGCAGGEFNPAVAEGDFGTAYVLVVSRCKNIKK